MMTLCIYIQFFLKFLELYKFLLLLTLVGGGSHPNVFFFGGSHCHIAHKRYESTNNGGVFQLLRSRFPQKILHVDIHRLLPFKTKKQHPVVSEYWKMETTTNSVY